MWSIVIKVVITIIFIFSCQCSVLASWYGCFEYTTEQLDKMSEKELHEAYDKYVKLSHEIYEDAAVQSIMDKRIYHFRSQQYLDCVKYTEEIDRAIKRRFPKPTPDEK